MEVNYELLEKKHTTLLVEAGDQLFDYPVDTGLLQEYINDKRHHLLLAIVEGKAVGFASGFHYIHPDKQPQLFVNEVSVLEAFQGRGIGRTLVKRLVEYGKSLGCTEAWVGTELSNTAARKAYRAAGGKESDKFILIEF